MQSQPQVILLVPTSGGPSSNRPPSLKLPCLPSPPSSRPQAPPDSWVSTPPVFPSLVGSVGMMIAPIPSAATPSYVMASPNSDAACFTFPSSVPPPPLPAMTTTTSTSTTVTTTAATLPGESPTLSLEAGVASSPLNTPSSGFSPMLSHPAVQRFSLSGMGCSADERQSEATRPEMDRGVALQKSSEALAQRFEEAALRLNSAAATQAAIAGGQGCRGIGGAQLLHERLRPSVMEYSSHRASSCKSIRAKWTAEEDRRVMELVEKHGHNWCPIAQELGTGRSGKQIRERWKNQLRSGINKVGWANAYCARTCPYASLSLSLYIYIG